MNARLTIAFLALILASRVWLAAAENQATLLPPPVPLKEAVRLAEKYAARKKIDVSKHFLGAVQLGSDPRGQLFWDVKWMSTDKALKGGWFIVRVEMNKAASLIRDK
jgi:hypothetical protein